MPSRSRRRKKVEFNYKKWTYICGVIALLLTFFGLGSGFLGNVISYYAWKHPQSDSTKPPVYVASDSSRSLYIPVTFTPTPVPKSEAELNAMTADDVEKVKEQFERKVFVPAVTYDASNPDSEWFDTGILIQRDKKVWFVASSILSVKVDNPEIRKGFIDNDFEEQGEVFVDDEGNILPSLTIDSNDILGYRDYGTLKLRVNSNEGDTIKVVLDDETYQAQLPDREGCSF